MTKQPSESKEPQAVITVYVRKGASDNYRVLSFQRPDRIPVRDLFDKGLALDGNSIRGEIGPDLDEVTCDEQGHPLIVSFLSINGDKCQTLADALIESEKWLIDFLGKYNYEVKFQ